MPIELKETNTDTRRGGGRSTVQTGGAKYVSRSGTTTKTPSTRTSTETTTEGANVVTRSSTRSAAASSQVSSDDATLVLRFTIPFQNDEPVAPPGETEPSAC